MTGARQWLALIAALATAVPGGARADDGAALGPQAVAMTLDEALAYAHAHQPSLRAAKARVDAAIADAEVPRARWRPTIGAMVELIGGTANNSTAVAFSGPTVDLPRIGGTRTSASPSITHPEPSTLAAVGITQEIFDFGRIAAEAAASDAVVDIERQTAASARLDLDLDVRESFFAVLAAHAVFGAADAAFKRTETHRDYAKAGVASGLRSPIELTRAEADLARFDLARLRARGGVAIAESVLAAAIGAQAPLVDASGDAPAVDDGPPLAAAIARATENDPVLRTALARVTEQEKTTLAIGAELRPQLYGTAAFSGRAGGFAPTSGSLAAGNGWLPDVPNWDVGVVLSVPIYDGTIAARRDAARTREEAVRAEVDVARQRIVANVQRSYITLQIAKEALPALERAETAAKANDAQAEARFKQGLGTSVELADAEALLTDADIQIAEGRFAVARARAALGRAIAEGL